YPYVLNKNIDYAAPLSNYYSRRDRETLLGNPFRGSDRAVWDRAMAAAKADDHATAIKIFDALLKKHPQQWPLLQQLAAWWAHSGEHEKALRAIGALATVGVAYRSLFEDDPTFESLSENAQYQKLLAAVPAELPDRLPAAPFSGRITYGLNGLPVGEPSQGVRHLLSTVLAVTHSGGTSLEEAIE